MIISNEQNGLQQKVQFECEYPGQTMMVALAIMLNFDSLDEAKSKGKTFSKASECLAVPGAGCAVGGAIDVLTTAKSENMTAEQVLELTEERWRYYAGHQDSYKDRVDTGLEKAKPFIKDFKEAWENWK